MVEPIQGCGDCDPCIGGRPDQCAVGHVEFKEVWPAPDFTIDMEDGECSACGKVHKREGCPQ